MLKNIVLLATLALAITACAKDDKPTAASEDQTEGKAQNNAGSTEHAAADVQPGSHDDWCGEHGVAESQCTRCNPDLAAAFRATGDWCEAHGLPDSQCLKCNPELDIVRPAPAPVDELEE